MADASLDALVRFLPYLRTCSSLMRAQVSAIHTLSGRSSELAQLASTLKKWEELLSRTPAAQLEVALAALQPGLHTLGYLYLLCVPRLDRSGLAAPDSLAPVRREALSLVPPLESFIAAAIHFLLAADEEQVKQAPEKCALRRACFSVTPLRTLTPRPAAVATLCRRLRDACVTTREPSRGLAALAAASRKVAPSRSYLTPQHVDLLLLSLLSLNYGAAAALLEEDALEVVPALTGLVPKDFLLYCYYGALVLCGLNRLPRAAELLMQALVAPSHALNAIQVAAYQKLTLVSMLCTGSVAALPKYTSSAVMRHVKCVALGPYLELEKCFTQSSEAAMAACLATHRDALKADGNWGLACQLAAALPGRAVHRLTSTYLTLSLADLAAAAGLAAPKDAELLVRRMVERGEILACVDARAGQVAFREDPEQFCTHAVAARLQTKLARVQALAQRVKDLDEALQLEPAYASKAIQMERQTTGGAPGAPGGSAMAQLAAQARFMGGVGAPDMDME